VIWADLDDIGLLGGGGLEDDPRVGQRLVALLQRQNHTKSRVRPARGVNGLDSGSRAGPEGLGENILG
jgi:hypothetical protein